MPTRHIYERLTSGDVVTRSSATPPPYKKKKNEIKNDAFSL